MSGRHWFPFYAKDFLIDKDVEALSDAQFRMLIRVWCRCCLDGGVPEEPTGFSKIMGCRKDTAVNMLKMLPLFLQRDDKEGGLLVSKRLEEETEKYNKIVERNRVNGRKGGRPPKPNGLNLGNPKKSQPQPQPQEEYKASLCEQPKLLEDIQGDIHISQPPINGHKRKPKAPEKCYEPSIAEILVTDGTNEGDKLHDRFWRTAKLWDAGKNHKPREAAKIYREIYNRKVDLTRVWDGACKYYNSFKACNRSSHKDEFQYMLNFQEWLAQEGWEAAIHEQEAS